MTRKNGSEMLKKIMAAAMAAMLLLSTAACGSSKVGDAEASASPSAEPTATPVPTQTITVATVINIDDFLNIRSEANTTSEVVGKAYSGDEFEVLTENYTQEWHEISYNGTKAYVYADFVLITEKEVTVQDGNTSSGSSEASPDPNAPIIVNGSGRQEVSSESSEDGMTAETIRDTEDPERR